MEGRNIERSIKEDLESAGSVKSDREHIGAIKSIIRAIRSMEGQWGAKSSGPSQRTWSRLAQPGAIKSDVISGKNSTVKFYVRSRIEFCVWVTV